MHTQAGKTINSDLRAGEVRVLDESMHLDGSVDLEIEGFLEGDPEKVDAVLRSRRVFPAAKFFADGTMEPLKNVPLLEVLPVFGETTRHDDVWAVPVQFERVSGEGKRMQLHGAKTYQWRAATSADGKRGLVLIERWTRMQTSGWARWATLIGVHLGFQRSIATRGHVSFMKNGLPFSLLGLLRGRAGSGFPAIQDALRWGLPESK
jgi:hypothetical protein